MDAVWPHRDTHHFFNLYHHFYLKKKKSSSVIYLFLKYLMNLIVSLLTLHTHLLFLGFFLCRGDVCQRIPNQMLE